MAAVEGEAAQRAAAGQGPGFSAMVLAGGLGTRLLPSVADRPKPLAEVAGEPFLARLLDQLAAAGCERAILCTGHLGDQIEREFGGEHAGVALCYSREPSPLGTGGALRHALPMLLDAQVLVMNGDSYADIDLRAFVAWARARTTAQPGTESSTESTNQSTNQSSTQSSTQPRAQTSAMVALEVEDCARYGTVVVDAEGRVESFVEKHGAGRGLVNAGIYWLPRSALARAPAHIAFSLERQLLPAFVQRGLAAYRAHCPFLDIGTPESYAAAEAFFAACAHRRMRARKGLLVVDRDGTLIAERHYLADPQAVELLPGVVQGLRTFAEQGYELAIVTNQSGIGRGYFDGAALAAVHGELRRQLEAVGVTIHGIWHCPHHPDAGCACRKPEPELLQRAMHDLGYAPEQCLVVGDKVCDIQLGARLGVRTALVRTGYGAGTERDGMCTPDVVVDDLAELAARELRRRTLHEVRP